MYSPHSLSTRQLLDQKSSSLIGTRKKQIKQLSTHSGWTAIGPIKSVAPAQLLEKLLNGKEPFSDLPNFR